MRIEKSSARILRVVYGGGHAGSVRYVVVIHAGSVGYVVVIHAGSVSYV